MAKRTVKVAILGVNSNLEEDIFVTDVEVTEDEFYNAIQIPRADTIAREHGFTPKMSLTVDDELPYVADRLKHLFPQLFITDSFCAVDTDESKVVAVGTRDDMDSYAYHHNKKVVDNGGEECFVVRPRKGRNVNDKVEEW